MFEGPDNIAQGGGRADEQKWRGEAPAEKPINEGGAVGTSKELEGVKKENLEDQKRRKEIELRKTLGIE